MRKIILLITATALLGSCQLYKGYERPAIQTQGLYRDTLQYNDTLATAAADTTTIGHLPWYEVFRDTALQALINQGLAGNADLQTARLRIKQAEATLLSSRLAYLPSLSLNPEGTISSLNHQSATRSYQLPVAASWEIDLFGSLLNAKRSAKAALLQSEAYRQAVQTQLIASIANSYYTLLMLDRQLLISETTTRNWQQSVATMKAMKAAALTNEVAVTQSEANYYQIQTTLPELLRQIREVENALSLVLGQAPETIPREGWKRLELPASLSVGVPLQLLSLRPDVKQTEMALAIAYYGTNAARSSFYPKITIDGSAGWTNSAGTAILHPARFLATAIGSLVQPLFNRGANIARLKIAKAQQEEAALNFRQSLLNAGSEVSNALYQYHSSGQKETQRARQITALEQSVRYTQSLMRNGTSTYLEVLTAQQSLLTAQLTQVSDQFEQMQAVINLYQALGGGSRDMATASPSYTSRTGQAYSDGAGED